MNKFVGFCVMGVVLAACSTSGGNGADAGGGADGSGGMDGGGGADGGTVNVAAECAALCEKVCAASKDKCSSSFCSVPARCSQALLAYVVCANKATSASCIGDQPAASACTTEYQTVGDCILGGGGDGGADSGVMCVGPPLQDCSSDSTVCNGCAGSTCENWTSKNTKRCGFPCDQPSDCDKFAVVKSECNGNYSCPVSSGTTSATGYCQCM